MADDDPGKQDNQQSPEVRRGSVLRSLIDKWKSESGRLASQTDKANEYGEIVLWHRWVDANLSSAIRAHFVPDTKTAADKLFIYPGSLASFSQRTHLGRCMGLYGPITYADLKIINDIRNKFAHPRDDVSGQLEIFGFEHPDIVSDCDNLNFLRHFVMTKSNPPPSTTRGKYIETARIIAFGLWADHVIPPALPGLEARIVMESGSELLP